MNESWGGGDVEKEDAGIVASLVEFAGWGEGRWLGGLGGQWGGADGNGKGVSVSGWRPHSEVPQHGTHPAAGGQQGGGVGRGEGEGKAGGVDERKGGGGPEGAVVDVPLPLPRAMRAVVRAVMPGGERGWASKGELGKPAQLHQPSLDVQLQTQQQQPVIQVGSSSGWSGVGDLLGDDLPYPVLPAQAAAQHSTAGACGQSCGVCVCVCECVCMCV